MLPAIKVRKLMDELTSMNLGFPPAKGCMARFVVEGYKQK